MYFPFLKYGCSLEINTARTAAYLANRCEICTEDIPSSVFVNNTCDILNWEIDPEDGVTIQPASYVSPAADAPWADGENPESARFLGFIIDQVTKPTHIKRNVTSRISGSGGGVLETLRSSAQVYEIEVFLFACDELAMEYGFRYLTNSLADGGCDDPCTHCELEYRDACPSFSGTPTLDEFNQGRWILHSTGITSAPEWVDPPVRGMDWFVRKARFSIASELPWKFECPEPCTVEEEFEIATAAIACGQPFETFFCVESVVACAATEASTIGETGFIIEVTAGSLPLSTVELRIIPDQYGWACDPDAAPTGYVTPDPCDLVLIEDIPAGYTFTYDTSIEKVFISTNAGVVLDGTPYLTFDGDLGRPPTYPTVRCGEYCIQVAVAECSVSPGAMATIQTVHREF